MQLKFPVLQTVSFASCPIAVHLQESGSVFSVSSDQSYRIIQSQNHLGWKRPLTSSSPTINLTLPSPSPNHVPKHHIYTSFKYLQGWWLNHFPGQPVPMLDKPFSEEVFPNIQSKPPRHNLRPFSLVLLLATWEKTDTHLATTSFQVAVESDKVSLGPPFLQSKESCWPH